MLSLLEEFSNREVDDKVGRTVDNQEEVADTDKNRDPDRTLAAAAGVKKGYLRVEDILTEIQG